jgi:ADP-heptose:LPS heptosyltransferase
MMARATRTLKRTAGRAWFELFERMHPPPSRSLRPEVALIRADGVGDLLFSLPLLESIRARVAPLKTVLVCSEAARPLAEAVGVADEVLAYDAPRYRTDPTYRWKIWTSLRVRAPQRALSLGFHRSPTSEELTLATGAPETASLSGNDEMIDGPERLRFNRRHTTVIDVPDHIPERLKYDRWAAIEGWGSVNWDRQYTLDGRTVRPARASRQRMRRVVLLAPGGSASIRQWPSERWVDTADRWSGDTAFEVRLVGGPGDAPLLRWIAARTKRTVFVDVASTTLELARSIMNGDVLVGIDSAPSHIAARWGVPAVVVLGGGHFSRYFPYGSAVVCNAPQVCYECNWRCHRDRVYCLTDITVDQVDRAVRERLAAT